MNSTEVLEIGKQGIFVLLEMALPILLVALIVGLVISLLQALTQIQEATLSFVPKLIAISLALLIFLPMMGSKLMDYTENLYQKIADIEQSDDGQ
jgi:flagellar biosynthetic protein FliQ